MEDSLVSVNGVVEILGVSRSRVYQLIKERKDFPKPAALTHFSQQKVTQFWKRVTIEQWAEQNPRRNW